jgi:hypothetical protein
MRLIVAIVLWRLLLESVLAVEPLRISEFAAGGRQGLTDEDGDSPDWIEIQNISAETVDLAGWSLKSRRDQGWLFPATNLPGGKFLVVFASGKDRRATGARLHTDFKLSSEGGRLVLRAPNGNESSVENYPPQVPGVSFGLADAGSNLVYLTSRTPGRTNSAAVCTGPYIVGLTHTPRAPRKDEPLVIQAKIVPSAGKVAKASVRYRVMFERETELEMHDDGQHDDGAAGDGTYGAQIPAATAQAGQMIRYCVLAEDEHGRKARWPLFARRDEYSAYQGTVVVDPSIQSRLPVVHMFSPRNGPVTGSGRNTATSSVLFYEGELYDNVAVSDHGQISRGFPKPSFNLKFPRDHRFRYREKEARVSEVKILGNFADKSKIRNTLAYEMIAAAGSIGHFAFPVRIQQDGRFLCVAEMIEDGDDRWLERVGRDPHGALYKMYDVLAPGCEAEKKTRKSESPRDLFTLASAMAEDRPLADRAAYAYGHVDIPQCISYLVAMALISSGDHGHKNYYLYRDSRGSREWALLPWDVDLSWGRNWTKTYFDDRIYVDNPLNLYRAGTTERGRNPLYNLFFEHPEFRQMYLRRLRTVMDELLKPPGTPPESLVIEKRIRELIDSIDPPEFRPSDADLDNARWPHWRPERSAREEAERIITEYLPGRRNFLFKSARARLFGEGLPPSQKQELSLGKLIVERAAETADQFICVTNQNKVAVDVSGWTIAGSGIEHRFRPGTVIPSGKALYVVADVNGFRARKDGPRGGQSLLVQGNWKGTLSQDGVVHLKDRRARTAASSE